MPFIKKIDDHTLQKNATAVESTALNTTTIERKINNRVIISTIMPKECMLGDIWKDISREIPVQRQCVGFDRFGIPIWEDFIEMSVNEYNLSAINRQVGIIEGLIHALDKFYDTEEFNALINGYSNTEHVHPELQAMEDLVAGIDANLVKLEIDTYSFATKQPFIYH